MSNTRQYHHRGSLADCILALVARAGTIGNSYLSIVANDRSKYYGLVDDTYLSDNDKHPEDDHMRLMLRINDSELQVFHDVFESLQGDMFSDASSPLPKTE